LEGVTTIRQYFQAASRVFTFFLETVNFNLDCDGEAEFSQYTFGLLGDI
jgi:hypothetical protein